MFNNQQPSIMKEMLTTSKNNNNKPKRKRRKRDPNKPKGHNRNAKGGIPQVNVLVEHLMSERVRAAAELKISEETTVLIDPVTTLYETLNLFSSRKLIYGAVCRTVDTFQGKTTQFYGFVCVAEILTCIVDEYDKCCNLSPEKRREAGIRLLNSPVTFALHRSKMNKINEGPQVNDRSPLFQSIGVFQKKNYRVPIRDDSGKMKGILTQFDIVRYLVSKLHDPKFEESFTKTILEMNLGKKSVCVSERTRTINVLKMINKGIAEGIAVENKKGVITGCVSAEVLTGLFFTKKDCGEKLMDRLELPIHLFLQANRTVGVKSCLPLVNGYTPLYLLLLETFSRKARILSSFLVDENNRPLTTICLTDIMVGVIQLKQEERKG